jgi:hypothetical protein
MIFDKARFVKSYPINKGSILRPVLLVSIGGFFSDKPENSQNIFYYVSNRKIEFKKDFQGSVFQCLNLSTDTKIFDIFIQQGNSSGKVATITVNAGEKVGNFSTISGVNHSLRIGDAIYIQAPSIQDSTLSDICFSLAGDLIP